MLSPEIPSSAETGKLKVMHLKRYWNKSILKRNGALNPNDFSEEWHTDTTLLAILGLGLEPTVQYLYLDTPSFDQFENWVFETAGEPDKEKIKLFNRLFSKESIGTNENKGDSVLKEADLDFWEKNGYLIIRDVVSREDCDITIEALCKYIGVERNNPATWYNDHQARQGIMVQLFQHPALMKNRLSLKIRKAYEELWRRTDLFVNTDRVGFNPPETDFYHFPGPHLHWDVSLKLPIPFGLQGILYLSDTAENQGAFTLVPGFHHQIEHWLNSLPANKNPRTENLYMLGAKPIAANAGDFIIWHQSLPHGSSPNTSNVPRFVQYINFEPADKKDNDTWL